MSHVPTVLKSDRSVFDKMLPVDDTGDFIGFLKFTGSQLNIQNGGLHWLSTSQNFYFRIAITFFFYSLRQMLWFNKGLHFRFTCYQCCRPLYLLTKKVKNPKVSPIKKTFLMDKHIVRGTLLHLTFYHCIKLMSQCMRFPTMCHFDMCRLGRASAASF